MMHNTEGAELAK